ncbi:LPXTG cell wall anchor domain-containing protein [Arcanobacterium haemolyticum]|nr:LPXTG cell wall anchor domain-containing protein [Arcanobacterium haemolyticum]
MPRRAFSSTPPLRFSHAIVTAITLAVALVAGLWFMPSSAQAAEPDWGVAETEPHTVLDHSAPLTKFADGQNHAADVCSAELVDMLTDRDGNDITFTTNDGRVVNATWTFCAVRQAYLDARAQATGRELAALNSATYKSFFYVDGYTTPILADLDYVSMYFREDNQTGEISLGVPYPGTNRFPPLYSGFAPGDTLYRSVNLRVNHYNHDYDSSRVAFFAFGRGTAQDPATGEFGQAGSYEYMTLRDLSIDGQPSPLFDSRESQISNEGTSDESAVWQEVYSRKNDGDEVKRLYQFALDVPEGQIIEIQFRNNFSTTGDNAGTTFKREGVHRIPEVEVISVLDKDYRLARGLVNAAGEPDTSQQIEPRDVAASFTPLDLTQPADLPQSVFAANIIGRPVWAEETYNARQYDDAFPNFGLVMTENDWLTKVTEEAPGYIEVGTDLAQEPVSDEPGAALKPSNVTFEFGVNPTDGRIQLRKYFYRTFRPIPAALEIHKKDAHTDEALGGAQFELWSADGSTKLIDEVFTTDENGKISLFDTAGKPLSEALTDSVIKTLPYADNNGVITTEQGYLLEPGTYALREVKAPEGYELPAQPDTQVTIDKRDDTSRFEPATVTVTNTQTPTEPVPTPTDPETPETPQPTPYEPGTPQPKLPLTGSSTAGLLAVAGMLVLAGATLALRRKA